MADGRAVGIAGRALFNECVGDTDEAGDDICVMIGGEGDNLAKVALDALEAAGYSIIPSALLADLVDPDVCWFDHHGGCQAHGHFPPNADQAWTCPVESAKTVLAAAVRAQETPR